MNLAGDLIVGIDRQEISSPQDLSALINHHRAGDVVVLTVFRGRRRLEVKVQLGDAKDGQQV